MGDEPTFNGYANQPSLDFETWTANTRVIYDVILAYGQVLLQRVPSMTPQTLGYNIKTEVRTLISMARNGEELRHLGWADHLKLPQAELRKALLEMADDIGVSDDMAVDQYHLIDETDIGESWIETLTYTDPED